MSRARFVKSLVACGVVSLAASAQAVTIPASSSVGPPPVTSGSGLAGKSWKSQTPAQITGIEGDGPAFARHYINNVAPDGRFTATNFEKLGNDLTPIQEWLNADAASFTGTNHMLDDGIAQFTGFLKITEPGDVVFHTPSDDGTKLTIGGEVVILNDGSHGEPGPAPDGTATFTAPGTYPVELVWWNGNWTDPANPASHGGANLHWTTDGGGGLVGGVMANNLAALYPTNPIPEPAAVGAGILAAGMLCLRRWS